ncbi:acetyl-CoA acetyltransferase [Mycolicibacterium chubuense]|uniref:Putative acetyl-CoA acyltransferase n=1 Tax=Mycolicibacterium chubuense TaxID=1800 RepID=A0A0J6VXC0_MYCCU|nr:acetyl-CoA acetyltransferase [Mycolicibacterium chubuense]KMO74113.1 putative acetyl-CoA acyltransferase [Mycolicibacterium chubuense]ORA42622.1 acetyl-CoA acetyltransferase [Mycolicibacterium chubuense]SPX97856.1 acetyl-CoA acetyltransferase [Mycolicibacterium chubuense]
MSAPGVWILGGYQSDFARNFDREGLDFSGLTAEVVDATLAASRLDAADIGVVHVANAFGELFARQGHLGAMPATVHDGLWDVPATRHEAACASGSVATLAAMADLRSGAYRTALVIGVELEKTVPGDAATSILGTAAWTGHEGADAKYVWPHMFETVAAEYDRRHGLDDTHLRAIAARNLANARANPNAQTRTWAVPEPLTDDDVSNPTIEGRLRRFDCSQLTDGGAGVVLVTDDWLRDHPTARPLGRIDGWGHRTVGLGLQQKLDRSAGQRYVLPHVRSAVQDAFDRAQVRLDDIDGFEVHDCFTPSEYLAIDHIGLTPPGESWKAIESGDIDVDGRCPINPSGGLIGGGHPVGASGVRMLLDAAKQVSGTAGSYQVDGAQTFGTLNFGGSTATTVTFVVGSHP